MSNYTQLVLDAYTCVSEITDDNKCEFHSNLGLFLEGLEEDVNELEYGREVRHLPIRPKTTDDVE